MSAFTIFSTPRSGSTLLMRIIESFKYRCGGECKDLFYKLKDLHDLRKHPILQFEDHEGMFPAHRNYSNVDEWNFVSDMIYKKWLGVTDQISWGCKNVHLGTECSEKFQDLVTWIDSTFNDMCFIFLTRNTKDIISSMEEHLDWWIPSYVRYEADLEETLRSQKSAFMEAYEKVSKNSIFLNYNDLLNYDILQEKLKFAKIYIDRDHYNQQITLKLK